MDPGKNSFEISAKIESGRKKYLRKVTWIGFLINMFLSVLKFAAGYFGKSQAVIADAVHSLTDTTTDLAVIAASDCGRQCNTVSILIFPILCGGCRGLYICFTCRNEDRLTGNQ